jgi:hypothetical protein
MLDIADASADQTDLEKLWWKIAWPELDADGPRRAKTALMKQLGYKRRKRPKK